MNQSLGVEMATDKDTVYTNLSMSENHIIADLDVDNMARSDGDKDIPTPDATEMTLNERTILEFFRGLARGERNFIKDSLDNLKAQMSKIFHSRIIEELNGYPEELRRLNNNSRRKEEQTFIELRTDALRREKDVKSFAGDNCLRREPQPRDNPMQIAFWIAAIVLLETSLNATFFAVGSDRGLLGGAIQAFVISFLNVMMAWLLGRFSIPLLNHCLPEKKYMGYGAVLLLVGGAFFLNLFAGHYRAALEDDAFKAVLMAVQSFSDNFMSIKSAQGWLLTAVGGAAFTCLTAKIYLSDDPYPGYGKVSREYLQAKEAWTEHQRKFMDTIISNYNQIESKRAASTDKLGSLEVGYGVLLDKVGRFVEFYDSTLLQVEGMCNKVINYYRVVNKEFRKSRTAELPPYFSQPVDLGIPNFSLNPELETEEANQAELARKFDEYRQNDSARIKDDLDDIHKEEINNLDAYFGNV